MTTELKHRRNRPARVTLILGISFVVGMFLFVVAVPLFATCWHAVRGDNITYNDWIIHVPRKFFSWGNGTMWKLSFGAPFIQVPYGHITLFERGKNTDLSSDYSLFENSMVQQGINSGLHVDSRQTIMVDGREARCLQMSGKEPAQNNVRCIIGGERTVVFYEGYPQYIPEFYSMLRGMGRR